MIDKSDWLLPQHVRYSPRAAHLFALAEDPKVRAKVIRPGGGTGYHRVLDFRTVGVPMMVMETNLRSPEGGNKIIHFESAKMGLQQMKSNARRIFDFDMDEARVSRVDCAADVGIPVEWFRENVHIMFKGKLKSYRVDHSKRGAETCYWGMKPNEWRVYDKKGERWADMVKWNARLPRSQRMDENSLRWFFNEKYGLCDSAIVTRVERQMGGEDPKNNGLHLVGDLPKLGAFYPFARFDEDGKQVSGMKLPSESFYEALSFLKFKDQCIVQALRRHAYGPAGDGIGGVGLQFTKQWYQQQRGVGKSNIWRNWKKFSPFLVKPLEAEVNHNLLRDAFHRGVIRQLRGLPAAA